MTCKASSVWTYLKTDIITLLQEYKVDGNVRELLYMCLLEEFFFYILDNVQLLTTHSLFTLSVKAQHLSLLSAHSQEVVTFVSHLYFCKIINRILNIKSRNLIDLTLFGVMENKY